MTLDVSVEQSRLREVVRYIYRGGNSVAREDFLVELWFLLGSFVRWNRTNPLIWAAVQKYPDLVPRAFVILSILHGSFTYEPLRDELLSSFIGLLGKDLSEEELNATLYAQDRGEQVYYPNLSSVLTKVRDVYGDPCYQNEALPPTVYHGYTLLVLNNRDLLGGTLNADLVYAALTKDHARMRRILDLVNAPPKK